MTSVVSQATLVNMPSGWWPKSGGGGSLTLYDKYSYDYAYIWRTQPNVRTCVEFLARNIAQLGIHVFQREGENDRKRLRDHPLSAVLQQPLPASYKVTQYRMIESYMSDLGIFSNAYLLKIKVPGAPLGLLRLPPEYMTISGGLIPTKYTFNYGGQCKEFPPETIVHSRTHNADSSTHGLSPLETLRRVLAEEHAAGQYREGFWQNSARMNGIIERPKTSKDWSDTARTRFKAEFEALYSGEFGSGKTAILEDDMTWKPISFNPRDSEYLEGRKLTREECARAYHIPPPLVGILDHATYSNISEQHAMLYTDVLGPWISLLEQDFELQLLTEFKDTKGIYIQFNIEEKLQGNFETQSKSLQSAVGRPWMTANEARGRMNLPLIEDQGADELVTPLNVLVGGQASAIDSAPDESVRDDDRPKTKNKSLVVHSYYPQLFENYKTKWTVTLASYYRRQEASIVSHVPKTITKLTDIGGVWWDDERWNNELTKDLRALNMATAIEWANSISSMFDETVSEDQLISWITEHSIRQAESINGYIKEAVEDAIASTDPLISVKNVFLLAGTIWAIRQAVSAVTSAANFGAYEGAKKSKLTRKTWVVNSKNPRDLHIQMEGETVGIRDRFSNGMRWPGDPIGGAENNANCLCTLDYGRD